MSHHHQSLGQKQLLRMQRLAVARANANFQRFVRLRIVKDRLELAESLRLAQRRQSQDRHRSLLRSACDGPLDCSVQRYTPDALALFFAANLRQEATDFVVFQCNTRIAGTQRFAAAFRWVDDGLEPFSLDDDLEPGKWGEGRLFVFLSTVQMPGGESYAVLPATFAEREGGPAGHWTFPTAGLLRGQPYFIGHGNIGTYLDKTLQHTLLARPAHFDEASRHWFWFGRSTNKRENKLELMVQTPFNAASQSVQLRIPPTSAGADVASIACVARDDAGDPLGIRDTRDRPSHGIVRQDGRLHFFARPNQRDQHGKLLFAGRGLPNSEGAAVFPVTFEEDGVDITAELAANHRDGSGDEWFVSHANTRDRVAGEPLIWIPLDVL